MILFYVEHHPLSYLILRLLFGQLRSELRPFHPSSHCYRIVMSVMSIMMMLHIYIFTCMIILNTLQEEASQRRSSILSP